MKILSYGMALFAMHTDFDVTCMGTEASTRLGLIESKVLEPTVSEDYGLGAFGYLKEDLKLKDIASRLGMNLKTVFKYLSQSIACIQKQFRV